MPDLQFSSAPPPRTPESLQPVRFSLNVWRWPDDADAQAVEEIHNFECLPPARVSGARVTELLVAMNKQELASVIAAAMWAFLEQVMTRVELRRLNALLDEPSVYVDAGLLTKVANGVFGAYTGRPTRAPSASPSGQTPPAPTYAES